MRFITLVLFVAMAAQGCATAPSAREASARVQQISWTRGVERPAFQDENGVCHTFSPDADVAMGTLGGQVQACFEGALPVAATREGPVQSVKVVWEQVPVARIDELFAEEAGRSVLSAAGRRKAAAIFSVRGFYVYRGDTCHVIVSDHSERLVTLGHEFKHCVDGEFHDERGRWLHRAG